MIAGLIGIVHLIKKRSVLLNVNNVIYEIFVNDKTIYQVQSLSSDVLFHCTTVIYNEMPRLYGFLHEDDQNVFIILRNVRGIGAALANDIASSVTTDKLRDLVFSENISDLMKIKGVGSKVAQRIVSDLKNVSIPSSSSSLYQRLCDDVISALSNLGYSRHDIDSKAIKYVHECYSSNNHDIESILRYILKKMKIE